MTEFTRDQKVSLLASINDSFLKDSNCRDLVNDLTNENCWNFIRECNKYLFELSSQNKYLSTLIKDFINKKPEYKDSYDSILCHIYGLNTWNYGSAINGYMWVVNSWSKINNLYQEYQKRVEEYNQIEELRIKKEIERQEVIRKKIEIFNKRVEDFYERRYERNVIKLPIYRFFQDLDELSNMVDEMWDIPKNMHFEDNTYYTEGVGFLDYNDY